jgi:perosamine synthetase
LNHIEIGYNYRLSEMACALGRIQFGRIDEILALRRTAAVRYQELLGGIPGLELPALSLPRRSISWFVYAVRLTGEPKNGLLDSKARPAIQNALAARGIATACYFAPIHLQPAWSQRACANGLRLHQTEAIASRMLALPFFNRIQSNQQQQVAEGLAAALSCERGEDPDRRHAPGNRFSI